MKIKSLSAGLLYSAMTVLALFFSFAEGRAQDAIEIVHVVGVVTDMAGEPLAGVSVVVQGTQHGTSTDVDGQYSITVAKGAILSYSFIGFETKTVKVTKARYDIVLEEEAQTLDHVVVTGYSQVELRKSTGAVAVISGEDLKDNPLMSVDQLLQGKIAGVNVKMTSGRPGASATVRIRGTNTLTGNAEPLWVVDGVPLQKNVPRLNSSQLESGDFDNLFMTGVGSINPNDIESITVLKDAAAAAIYGSQAAGGVIVVTTKRGKAGRTSVSYAGSVTVQTKPSRSPDLMNSQEKLAWEQELWDEFSAEGYATTQAGTPTHYPVVGIVGQIRSGYGDFAGWTREQQDAYIAELGSQTTDWFDVLFRNTVSTSHSISVSGGGSEKLTYYISGAYDYNNGIVVNTDETSYNFSANINTRPAQWIKLDISSYFSYQKATAPSPAVDMFEYAYFANPYERLYNDDDSYRADATYFTLGSANGTYDQPTPENGFNIMREINETSSMNSSTSVTLTGRATINICRGLTFDGLASYSYSGDVAEVINGANTYAAFQDRPFENDSFTSKRTYGSISQTSSYNTSYMLRGQLNYARTFNNIHRLSVLGGAEIRSSYAKSITSKRYGYDIVTGNHSTPLFPSSDGLTIDYDKLASFGNTIDGLSGQSIVENAFASFYAAATYGLKGRYIFSGTVRTDGSNNFGSDEQFNANWSVSGAWNIDSEPWMQGISHILSSLSLRAGFGYTGGVNQSVYPVLIMDYLSTYRSSDTQFYRMGSIKNPPNPKLRWEKNQSTNVGLNFGFLNDRITGEVAYYHNRNMDLVTNSRVPTSTGFSTQYYNTSEQVNEGVEMMLDATIIRYKDFSWRVNVNAAYNNNRLTKYESPTGSIYGDYYVGYPQGKIFTGKSLGINAATGIYNFEMRPDIVVTDITDYQEYQNYLFYVGTSFAPWTGGFSTTFTYKRLTLTISGDFSIGAKVFNDITSPVDYTTAGSGSANEDIMTNRNDLYVNHLNVSREVTHRWTVDNPMTDGYPRLIDAYGPRLTDPTTGYYLTQTQPYSSTITNCVYLENVSYLKFSTLSLSYMLPERWIQAMRLSSMSVGFNMNNLFILTNYSGIDPETPGAVYPQSRQFTFSLNIGF